jgi:hypothetical protein
MRVFEPEAQRRAFGGTDEQATQFGFSQWSATSRWATKR